MGAGVGEVRWGCKASWEERGVGRGRGQGEDCQVHIRSARGSGERWQTQFSGRCSLPRIKIGSM